MMSSHSRRALVLLIGATLALSACASGPDLDLAIHESDRGVVYLERISDRSLRAAHPIRLSTDTMARVLRGVAVKENRGLLGSLVLGKSEAIGVFREEDVQFLAPLLVEGLTRAASDQKVGFRVVQTGTPWESMKGSLYAYGKSLYLSMPWLIPPSRYGVGGPALPPTILFFPESAKRPDSYRDAHPAESTLVLDYALLASLPADSKAPPQDHIPAGEPAAVTEQPAAPAQISPTIQAPIQSRDREFDAMKKELRDIKRQLAEQEAERNAQKHIGPFKQNTPATP